MTNVTNATVSEGLKNNSETNQTSQGTRPFHEPVELQAARLTIQTLLFLVGVLGNITVCFVTSRKRGRTSTGNLFILHLAIADLGILFINFPFVVLRSEFPYSWPFGRFICRALYPFADIFFGVEIGCITAIAFHRYKMLVHCTKPQITLENAKKIVFVIWFISFVFIVAPMIFVTDLIIRPHHHDCGPLWPNKLSEQLFGISASLMFYVIPLAIIVVTYIKIRTVLKTNTIRQDSYSLCRESSIRSNHARSLQNRRAVQILTPVVVIFAFSMLPFTILRFVVAFSSGIEESFKYMRFVFKICSVLLIANSSVNPIIYSVVNSEFRRDFSSCLQCKADKCCLDLTGESLTTVRKSTQLPNNRGRKNSAPLLGNDCNLPGEINNLDVPRRSLDSVLKGRDHRPQPVDDLLTDDKTKNLKRSTGVLLIKVNPIYESGGF